MFLKKENNYTDNYFNLDEERYEINHNKLNELEKKINSNSIIFQNSLAKSCFMGNNQINKELFNVINL